MIKYNKSVLILFTFLENLFESPKNHTIERQFNSHKIWKQNYALKLKDLLLILQVQDQC